MKKIVIPVLLLFLTIQTKAVTRTVCASGCNFTTISAAVNAAIPNDIIEIQDALITENTIVVNKTLTFKGQGQSTTIIQGYATEGSGDNGIFITQNVTSGLTITFEDLTLRHGSAITGGSSSLQQGGAFYGISNNGNYVFTNVTIEDNEAGGSGGGVFILNGNSVSFTNCVFHSNEVTNSSNNRGGGFGISNVTNVTFDNCTISENQAINFGMGGEIGSVDNLTMTNCTIHDNFNSSGSGNRGGGMYIVDVDNTNLFNCTFVDNRLYPTINSNLEPRGAGILITETSNVVRNVNFTNCIFADNTRRNNPNGSIANNDVHFGGDPAHFSLTENTSLAESYSGILNLSNVFTYNSDPNISKASCGIHTVYIPIAPSDALGNGSSGAGIPTIDICGFSRGTSIDLGSGQRPENVTFYTQGSGDLVDSFGGTNILNTQANGLGVSYNADAPLLIGNHFLIQSGHIIDFVNAVECKSLTINSGGQLRLNTSTATTTTLKIEEGLIINGTLAQLNNNNASAIRLETDNSGSPFDISGTGTIRIGHILMSGAQVDIKSGVNLEIKDHLSNDNPALFNNTSGGSDFNIESGATVTIWGDLYLDTELHSIGSDKGYDINLYGDLNIGRNSSNPAYQNHNLHLLSDDAQNFTSDPYNLIIHNGGKLLTLNPLIGGDNSNFFPLQVTLDVKDGGVLETLADAPFQSFVFPENRIILSNTSEVKFSGGGTQTIDGSAVDNGFFGNLTISGSSGNRTLGSDISISNDLNLETGGIDIGNFDIYMDKNFSSFVGNPFSNSSPIRYIKTNGTGVIELALPTGAAGSNIGSGVVVPCGNTNYNPIYIYNNGSADVFSIQVADEILTNGTNGAPLTNDAVGRTWNISKTNTNNTDAGLFLYWSSFQHLTGFDVNDCWVSHHDGTTWDILPGAVAGTTNNPSFGNMNFLHRENVTSFSPFGVLSSQPLPVELTNFNGKIRNDQSVLSWTTASEINNLGFEIQHSKDGDVFQYIGFVEGKGTTNASYFYEFIHAQPNVGINYYRLKQVDLDGQFEFSQTVALEYQDENQITKIYPTVTENSFFIETNDSPEISNHYLIVNQNGIVVKQFQLNQPLTEIDLTTFPAGSYFIFHNDKGLQGKIIKQP